MSPQHVSCSQVNLAGLRQRLIVFCSASIDSRIEWINFLKRQGFADQRGDRNNRSGKYSAVLNTSGSFELSDNFALFAYWVLHTYIVKETTLPCFASRV
jgi:hypothetical protein